MARQIRFINLTIINMAKEVIINTTLPTKVRKPLFTKLKIVVNCTPYCYYCQFCKHKDERTIIIE